MDIRLSFVKRAHEVKDKSSRRFGDWSHKYDRSILQFIIFRHSRDMFFKNILHDRDVSRVLDIGCGTGEFALQLKKLNKNIEVFGVDISENMINLAKAKANNNNLGIDFRVGDAERIPYEDNRFDIITCAHSFHHYPHKRKALQEMHRVLGHNGKIMIIDGCKDGLVGRFIFDVIVKRHEVDVHHLHSNQFRRLLTKVGFNNIVQKVFGPIVPLLFTKAVADK